MMRILPASSRCDSSSSMHIASSGPTAAYPRKTPWLSIGLSRVSTDCTRYREPFVSTTNASSCGISLPLLRELLQVLDGLPVVLHRDLHVRLDEVPRAREVPVPEAVPLPLRPAVVHLRLVEEVDLLQLVQVAVHGRLRRLQLHRQLLGGPTALGPREEALDEQAVGNGVVDRFRVRLWVVALRKVAYLLEELRCDVLQVLERRERRVAHHIDLETHGDPIPAVVSTRGR